jgi:hypothetical protein
MIFGFHLPKQQFIKDFIEVMFGDLAESVMGWLAPCALSVAAGALSD